MGLSTIISFNPWSKLMYIALVSEPMGCCNTNTDLNTTYSATNKLNFWLLFDHGIILFVFPKRQVLVFIYPYLPMDIIPLDYSRSNEIRWWIRVMLHKFKYSDTVQQLQFYRSSPIDKWRLTKIILQKNEIFAIHVWSTYLIIVAALWRVLSLVLKYSGKKIYLSITISKI